MLASMALRPTRDSAQDYQRVRGNLLRLARDTDPFSRLSLPMAFHSPLTSSLGQYVALVDGTWPDHLALSNHPCTLPTSPATTLAGLTDLARLVSQSLGLRFRLSSRRSSPLSHGRIQTSALIPPSSRDSINSVHTPFDDPEMLHASIRPKLQDQQPTRSSACLPCPAELSTRSGADPTQPRTLPQALSSQIPPSTSTRGASSYNARS